ncbi:hypothetical protein DFH09DRAFT_1331573 [Mycena vulgaris]|nr:hypothetical protein DFH09DRAFT_1331573 [Mycena vulgaris]
MVGRLRSGNAYNPPAPMDDGLLGNLEMDASSGTSNSTSEMDAQGTSVVTHGVFGVSITSPLSTLTPSRIKRSPESVSGSHEPRSSSAAETEHCSCLADVDDVKSSSTSEAAPSHHHQDALDTIVDGGAVSEGPYRLDNDGFQMPRRSMRTSAGSTSPVLETTPKFFGSWFSQNDTNTEVYFETGFGVDKRAFIKQWADYTEADGLGDLPSEWKVSSERSLSPVDTGMEFSFDEVMAELSRGMSPTTRETIERRTARMRNQRIRTPQSVSLTSKKTSKHSRKTAGNVSIHMVQASRNTTAASKDNRSSPATTTPRYTTSAKGKGCDPRERPDIVNGPTIKYEEPSLSPSSSSSEMADDEARLRQIESDGRLAILLQRLLDERTAQCLPKSESKSARPIPSKSKSGKSNKVAPPVRKIRVENPPKDEDHRKVKSSASPPAGRQVVNAPVRSQHSGTAQAPPLVRRTALDQVPEKSYLFKSLESDSETGSESTKRARRAKKAHSKGKKSGKKKSPLSSDDPSSGDTTESSSDSSLSSSSSESSSGDNKRRRKERAKKARCKRLQERKLGYMNSKPDPPFEYEGQEDFHIFQKWILEVKDCIRYGYISCKRAVSWIKKYLGGRASAWYMREVAKDPRKWTLNRLIKALFNYCFPANFRSIQHEKYERSQQRGHPIRDYCTELTDLRDSIGDDISERQFIIRFWQGADTDIRIHWAKAGYDRERSSMDDLETFAANHETATLIANEEKKCTERADNPNTPNRSSGRGERGTEGESLSKPPSAQPMHKPTPKKLSKAEMNQYRAEGKCFECGSTKHIWKDCPDLQVLKPKGQSNIQANATLFEEIERLRLLRDAQKFGVFSVSLEPVERSPEHLKVVKSILLAQIRADLLATVQLSFDDFCLPGDDVLSPIRFEVEETEFGFIIYDRHRFYRSKISIGELLHPHFDFTYWFRTCTFEPLTAAETEPMGSQEETETHQVSI